MSSSTAVRISVALIAALLLASCRTAPVLTPEISITTLSTEKAMTAAFRHGIKGIKIQVSGRLGGAEIARREWYSDESVPLHTLRANVDYGTYEAQTSYGIIGVKAWVYHGEVQTLRRQAAVEAKALQGGGIKE